MKRSPGSLSLADIEIALARAGASLYLRSHGSDKIATVCRGSDEHVYVSPSLTDAIYVAAELAGIDLFATVEAAA